MEGPVVRTRRTWIPLLALTFVLLTSACGGTARVDTSLSSPSTPSATANDINPVDRSRLADGGVLRWPISTFPVNFDANELDGAASDDGDIIGALLPQMFKFDATAQPTLRTEYLEHADLMPSSPKQAVVYRVNPKASWYDGTPITVADFEAQWKALRGTDPAFKVASTEGYDKIESVVRGRDRYEAVVTFRQPYADWRALFSPLYPASTNADPSVFNDGWKVKPLTTAGPFKLESVDQTAKTITLARNEKWWGRPAKLHRIIYRTIDTDAQIDALANGAIDFVDVGADVNDLRRAASMSGVRLRKAGGPNFRHIDFNGTSPFLSDVRVRRAIALATDRATIAKALLGPLGVPTTPLGNHIFMANQKGYRDNSDDIGRYEPAKAGGLLDEAGWKLSGTQRVRDGRPLELRIVIPSQVTTSKQESELLQAMLAQVGVKLEIQTVPSEDFFDKYIIPGDFDLTVFSWLGTVFPISSNKSIYGRPMLGPGGQLDIRENYGRIGSDQIDRLFDAATSQLDADKTIALGNQIDTMIWQEVHSLTLYQRPEIVAARSTLGNFGALGFASGIYEDIGFRKT